RLPRAVARRRRTASLRDSLSLRLSGRGQGCLRALRIAPALRRVRARGGLAVAEAPAATARAGKPGSAGRGRLLHLLLPGALTGDARSEEHTSELQSLAYLV